MSKKALVGDHPIEMRHFPDLSAAMQEFRKKEFLALGDRKRSERVNSRLLEMIQKEQEPCFLLSAVLEFVGMVDGEDILDHYTFNSFELWLNQHSGLSFEENARVRGKIAGKWIERSDYQKFFPIGMGRIYEGTHFVTAHKSPDLDTTVASFWGWMDSFAARVGDGLHVWNLPGGPASQIEMDLIFREIFGPAVFTHLPKTRTVLHLTGNDLMSQKDFMHARLSDSVASIDHGRGNRAIVIVDNEGFYLGDWRPLDVEEVRQVIILLSSFIRWFENNLHLELISLFAEKNLVFSDVGSRIKSLFEMRIEDSEPAVGLSENERRNVHELISLVFGIKEGLGCTFEDLGFCLAKFANLVFEGPEQVSGAMRQLFDKQGKLFEKRPDIFSFLESIVRLLHEAIFKVRTRLETLDIALRVKMEVFKHRRTFVTVRSNVDEILSKMGSYQSLTVAYPDGESFVPVGTIHATDLRKETLGTVSLRDFCNLEEMTIPPYLEVISVIDHHKSQLKTNSVPLAVIADVQSSNTLVAQLAFEINDRTSLGGQTKNGIESQIEKLSQQEQTPLSGRLMQRLMKRPMAAASNAPFFVHPLRERIEYLHFLYAILEDTDLLSKVSAPDVECVVQLLNRLKSLSIKQEVEILTLDDLPRDKQFPKLAAERILQNDEMYSFYRKVYAHKEKEIEKNLELAAKGKPSAVFSDTKEQNGCCRVGQTKMFAVNIPFFSKHADAIRKAWLEKAQEIFLHKPEIALHLHMISTIVSAEEVHRGKKQTYVHKDELWIWIPEGDPPIEQLKRFLHSFQSSPGLKDARLEVEFLGENAAELALIFKESFFDIEQKVSKKRLRVAVLRFKAGALNSRKAMVTPFLPTVVS